MTAQGRHKKARRTQEESSSKSWTMVAMSRRARCGVVGVDTRRVDGVFTNDVEVLVVAATDHVLTHVPPQLYRGVGGLRVILPWHTNVPWGAGPSTYDVGSRKGIHSMGVADPLMC